MSDSGVFDRHRILLFSIAYRMLGSVMEAEDVVQEAFVRWERADDSDVRSPRAYLSTVVTRLCLDQLGSARARREEYVGPWLPEPLPTDTESDIAETTVLHESISMAFLVLLESLSPLERAVFLLREVFDYDYPEVSRIVGKSEANCRQIARRARGFVSSRRPRFESLSAKGEQLVGRFVEACQSGDLDGLLGLLSADVTLYSDGGGKTRAALNPIHGPGRTARFLLGILGKVPPGFTTRIVRINGGPGVVGYVHEQPMSVVTLDAASGEIHNIRIVVNPEKLGAIPSLTVPGAKKQPRRDHE
ncbi:MAG: RNA polymerase sigma-70 factor [Rubrobacter sp.]|nr:RNA polymerase sigma-70 factor [Rubrobacter sp.]